MALPGLSFLTVAADIKFSVFEISGMTAGFFCVKRDEQNIHSPLGSVPLRFFDGGSNGNCSILTYTSRNNIILVRVDSHLLDLNQLSSLCITSIILFYADVHFVFKAHSYLHILFFQ